VIPLLAVQLGRIGDILNILPPCKLLGIKRMLVGNDFVMALEGQSYVQGVPWNGDIEDLSTAVQYARTIATEVLVPQLFGRWQPPGLPPRTRPSFVQDQWDRLCPGMGDRWGMLPLEFDRRDARREQALVRYVNAEKPMLLVNLVSQSSPYRYAPELFRHLEQTWAHRFAIVNLADVLAFAFCDLLGLYEVAAGLITADTATLHLARACPKLPVFRFVRPDHDATPVQQASQPYGYVPMDRIDEFVASLEGSAS